MPACIYGKEASTPGVQFPGGVSVNKLTALLSLRDTAAQRCLQDSPELSGRFQEEEFPLARPDQLDDKIRPSCVLFIISPS